MYIVSFQFNLFHFKMFLIFSSEYCLTEGCVVAGKFLHGYIRLATIVFLRPIYIIVYDMPKSFLTLKRYADNLFSLSLSFWSLIGMCICILRKF